MPKKSAFLSLITFFTLGLSAFETSSAELESTIVPNSQLARTFAANPGLAARTGQLIGSIRLDHFTRDMSAIYRDASLPTDPTDADAFEKHWASQIVLGLFGHPGSVHEVDHYWPAETLGKFKAVNAIYHWAGQEGSPAYQALAAAARGASLDALANPDSGPKFGQQYFDGQAASLGLRLADELPAVPVAPAKDPALAWQALDLMREHDRNITPSLENIKKIDNAHQIEALKILLEGDGERTYQISDKLPAILRFDNAFQVAALRAMVEAGRSVRDAMDRLAQISNQIQVDAIKAIIGAEKYNPVSDNLDGVLKFSQARQLQGLRLLCAGGKNIALSIESLARLSTDEQVDAIKTLIDGSTPEFNYSISDKLPAILAFSNPRQFAALKALVALRFPINQALDNLARVKEAYHVDMLQMVARNIQWRDDKAVGKVRRFLNGIRIDPAGLTALLTMAATVACLDIPFLRAIHHLWLLPFLGIPGLYYANFRWNVFRARRRARQRAKANAAWLDQHPKIQAELGVIRTPDAIGYR